MHLGGECRTSDVSKSSQLIPNRDFRLGRDRSYFRHGERNNHLMWPGFFLEKKMWPGLPSNLAEVCIAVFPELAKRFQGLALPE